MGGEVLAAAVRKYTQDAAVSDKDLKLFFSKETIIDAQAKAFLDRIEKNNIVHWLQRWEEYENKKEDTAICVNGECVIGTSFDEMVAYLIVLPPIGDGLPVSESQVYREMIKEKIVYGEIEGAYQQAVKNYFTIVTIAKGKHPIQGKDGVVQDLFERKTTEPHVFQEHFGNQAVVNYRDRRWLITVEEGQEICKLIQPSKGIAGKNVKGKPVLASKGIMPKIPMGPNTTLNEDKTKLIAACDGRLVYKNDAFAVEKQLVIHEDVGYNIGNIIMLGDVLIKGNVYPGFTVYAKGSLIVEGVIENAYLTAKGDISVKGIKGDGGSVVEAGGDLYCTFAESATLRAFGSITAESLLNCNVFSRRDVDVTQGKGIIIGGSVEAGKYLKAYQIGNQKNRPITIALGMNPEISLHIEQQKNIVEELKHKIKEYTKNINFLQGKVSLDEDYHNLLDQLVKDRDILQQKQDNYESIIEKLEDLFDTNSCQIIAEKIYPPISVKMGISGYQVRYPYQKSKIILKGADVMVVPQ